MHRYCSYMHMNYYTGKMVYCTEYGLLLTDDTFFCQQGGTKKGPMYHSKPPAMTDELQLIH